MGANGDRLDDPENQLLEQQIYDNNANIERERRALSERRLSIIKSQGLPDWAAQGLPAPPPKPKVPKNVPEARKHFFGGTIEDTF